MALKPWQFERDTPVSCSNLIPLRNFKLALMPANQGQSVRDVAFQHHNIFKLLLKTLAQSYNA